jgi:hypothetical protein
MEKILAGKKTWLDRVEKSEGWQIGVEAITAGPMAHVDPKNPLLDKPWEYWSAIAECSFPYGEYDPQAEWKAHKKLRGRGISYLRSRYVLTLLGSRSTDLPPALDRRIIKWIWNHPEGIGYLCIGMQRPTLKHIFNWFESMEILSRFQNYRNTSENAVK